jgi:hypothetical protein
MVEAAEEHIRQLPLNWMELKDKQKEFSGARSQDSDSL